MAHYRPKAEQLTELDRLADEIAALRKQVVLLRKQLTPNDEHAALTEEIDAILTRLDSCVAVERKAMAAILKRLRNTPRIAA
jgi:Tfp pilus assembly protein PilO